jgi:hypothetical protein
MRAAWYGSTGPRPSHVSMAPSSSTFTGASCAGSSTTSCTSASGCGDSQPARMVCGDSKCLDRTPVHGVGLHGADDVGECLQPGVEVRFLRRLGLTQIFDVSGQQAYMTLLDHAQRTR